MADAFLSENVYDNVVDWSPDGKFLAVVDRLSPKDSLPSILLISVESGERRTVVSPRGLYLGNPTLSPDGKTLALVQGPGYLADDIYVAPVAGGEPRRLTFDQRRIIGLAWTAGGEEIVFSSNRGSLNGLWRVSAAGGSPEPLSGGGEGALRPSISRLGNRLAYLRRRANVNIWRTQGPSWTGPRSAPDQVDFVHGNAE